MSYEVLIEKRHDNHKLKLKISRFLRIDINSIGNLFDDENKPVNIQVDYYQGDFITKLCVYKKDDLCNDKKEIHFAIYLSEIFGEDVLTTYWGDNPFLWVLTKPNGDIFKINEIPSEKEDFVQIDRKTKQKLNVETVLSSLPF